MNIRYEWVTLGIGALHDGSAPNVLRSIVGSGAALPVTGSATAAGSRPVAPASERAPLFARITAIDGNVVVATGADPTASQTNGILVMQGGVELLPVAPGDKLSFVGLA